MYSEQKPPVSNSSDFYDRYDYSTFWSGREYEYQSDRMAVSRFLSLIVPPYNTIVDLGVGNGRMIPLYERSWKKLILIDPSSRQLEEARREISHTTKVETIVGTAENIPIRSSSCDTLICIRTKAFCYFLVWPKYIFFGKEDFLK
jgi:ubiquinone/menaquinone biosynthesis C-methylase UbiE